MFLLENTFVVKSIRPYFTNKQKEIVKMPKIYFSDLGIRNMILENFTPLEKRPDAGAIIENAVLVEILKQRSSLEQVYFWRTKTKTEVDFVWQRKAFDLVPIEVKYQPQQAVIVTADFCGTINYQKTKIFFIPVFLL